MILKEVFLLLIYGVLQLGFIPLFPKGNQIYFLKHCPEIRIVQKQGLTEQEWLGIQSISLYFIKAQPLHHHKQVNNSKATTLWKLFLKAIYFLKKPRQTASHNYCLC